MQPTGPLWLRADDPGATTNDQTARIMAARIGCEHLHDAMQALCRKTARRLGCSEEVAALALNYSPAQLAKRVAA